MRPKHNNQTNAAVHLETIRIETADVSMCCGSKDSGTRDASLSTIVAWKQERVYLSYFLLRALAGVSNRQKIDGSTEK
jgi:hypothetical protein